MIIAFFSANWFSNSMIQFSRRSVSLFRSSPSEVFEGKGVLKIQSKFTGEHPCRSTISIKLQSNFIETTLRHGCSPVNLQHIFRTPFPRNTFGLLLLTDCLMWWVLYQRHFSISSNFAAQRFDPKVYGAFFSLFDSGL